MIELPLEPRLYAAVALCILISLTAFINSTITKNYSFVDREWSLSPILYAWILSGCLQGTGGNGRSFAMALFITCWGIRLTYNFWRRGGYQAGEQDYRWPILQKIITNPIAWHLFNLVFISFYQNILLLLICLPVYVASLSPSSSSWHTQDTINLSLCFLLLIGEYASDQQQWHFQSRKYKLLGKSSDLSKIPLPYRYGFRTTGLFRWTRHPNFFCEIMQWILLACFTIRDNNQDVGRWFYSFLGSLLLSTLFIGSTKFTEDITVSKYPLYKLYQSSTSAIIPFYARIFAPSLDKVVEFEEMAKFRRQDINWLAAILSKKTQ